ncbi:hypothetical protein [Cognaticolwellia aestuarii]|uniref:hypothetical protein n=1 Tax=Cognaticolwellia aestuarii TaxID=329993 RepID=UPI000986C951|nr:hypothetical protein [Cognaticolwellia aestuarii]
MLFTLSNELFEPQNQELHWLNKILNSCLEQHSLIIDPNYIDTEVVEASDWYNQTNEVEKILYQEAFTQTIQAPPNKQSFKVIIGQSFSAHEAYIFLSEHLTILVENSQNDSTFLRALFGAFSDEAPDLNYHRQNMWLRFGMGGGATAIPQVIDTEIQRFLEAGIPTERCNKFLRYLVLIDSDKKSPDEPYKNELQSLISTLENQGIPYHVLEKREMENYLPCEVLNNFKENNKFIEYYLNLSPVQKDFFDLEKGFPGKRFDQLEANVQELYADLSDTVKKEFRKSDLKKFTGTDRNDFKSEFPKLFETELVNKKSLLARTKHQQNPNELREIINKVRELL